MSDLKCLKKNPMNNDSVLEIIFQFCDVSSLKSIRLVSSKWRDLSLRTWRRKAVLQLGRGCHPYLNLNEFLQLSNDNFLQLKKHPFKRYSVNFRDFMPDSESFSLEKRTCVMLSSVCTRHVKIVWGSSSFDRFYDYVQSILGSDSLESLELELNCSSVAVAEPTPAPQFPLNCWNLRRLNLFTRSFTSADANIWGYVLKSLPRLEALSVGYDDDVDYMLQLWQREGIVALLKNFKGAGKLSLKELDMMKIYSGDKDHEYGDERDIIGTLAECKFPLERLSYHVAWDGDDEIPILQLLRSCKDTLKYFKTAVSFTASYSGKCKKDERTGRPRAILGSSLKEKIIFMRELKEFRVVNGLDWVIFFLGKVNTPKLEKLVVEQDMNHNPYHDNRYGLISVQFPEHRVIELPKLATFELHDNPHVPEREMIEKLARMMPNLAHLTIALDKSTFHLACHHFRGLKTLNVLAPENVEDYEEIDDEALTGLPMEWGVGLPRRIRAPNITDLQRLSSFRMGNYEKLLHRDHVKLTEHSVIHGFLQLPQLFNLSVAIKDVSVEMEERLLCHVKGKVELDILRKPDTSQLSRCANPEDSDWSDEDDSPSQLITSFDSLCLSNEASDWSEEEESGSSQAVPTEILSFDSLRLS